MSHSIPERWHPLVWLACAIVIFMVATGLRFGRVAEVGLAEAVPSVGWVGDWDPVIRSDHQWVVWVVSRNARTLVTSPGSFYDAEQCYPEERSLAFGEPVVTMGLLAVPGWLVTGDPIVTYNVVLWLMSLASALAMYWLIVEWTGLPAAGLVAGLLYGFQGIVLHGTIHPYSSDTTWLVLALGFTLRWLDGGRWRDALLLAACVALQMGTAFYSMVAAVLVAIPFGVEALVRRGGRGIRWPQLAVIAAVAIGMAALVFAPYLQLESSGAYEERVRQFFRLWRDHLPGGIAYFGAWPLVLVLTGLLVPARLAFASGRREVRPGLAIGALLSLWVASGPVGPFGLDLYAALASVLPGFDSVRVPMKIAIGAHAVASVLTGLASAAAMRAVEGQARRAVAAALVTITLAVVTTSLLVSDRTVRPVRPPEQSIALHQELIDAGHRGPLFEVPISTFDHHAWSTAASARILLSAFHHRPTTGCYPSQVPASQYELESIYRQLPEPEAFARLERLGFTSIVTHPPNANHATHEAKLARSKNAALYALAKADDAPIRLVGEWGEMRVYELVGEGGAGEDSASR